MTDISTHEPLYRIIGLDSEDGLSCKVVFNPAHPVLQGHFPGNPVVPGAWLIRCVHEAVEQATGRALIMSEASQVKFLHPVLAKQTQSVEMTGTLAGTEKEGFTVNASLNGEGQVFMKLRATFHVDTVARP